MITKHLTKKCTSLNLNESGNQFVCNKIIYISLVSATKTKKYDNIKYLIVCSVPSRLLQHCVGYFARPLVAQFTINEVRSYQYPFK